MKWFELQNPEAIASPGLLVDYDRVIQNIQQMIAVVGGDEHADRLRPHVKTHKMPDVIRLQMDAGISQFKAATVREAEMVAAVGGSDVLLAYQPVGPNLGRLRELITAYPRTSFATITDDLGAARRMAAELGDTTRPFRLFIDVDCGMHRTGIPLGPRMDELRAWIESDPRVQFAGLHVYDGHIHDPAIDVRSDRAMEVIESIREYDTRLPSPTIIGGGSPTFAIWASKTPWQCSPGTPVFWDVGYGTNHPEFKFSAAVALLTRAISKPGDHRVCLDLGYKSVASEMPLDRRVILPEIPDAKFIGQSEEHLVIETERSEQIRLGDSLLAFPRHICPTVALHGFASIVRQGRASGDVWQVAARDR